MKKFFKNIYNFFNNRYLILSIITILIAIIYIFQLFNLQIIQGAEYREKSQTRMLRTETVEAARGEIYDRNGVVLATNKLTNNVEIYKVNVDVDEQNTAIATLITILESNGDKIYSTFPINDTLDGFSFSSEEENNFKKEIGLKSESTFDDVINYYIDRYSLDPSPLEYVNGIYHFYEFVNKENIPILTYVQVADMPHANVPEQTWISWDAFFAYWSGKYGNLKFKGK